MFHMSFDFGFGYFWGLSFASGDKKIIEEAIEKTTTYPAGAQPAHVIGSHDVFRAWQSAGTEPWRYRNAALLQMTMKGSPFLYYGEELGLRPGSQIVVDDRDYARTPMPWTRDPNGHGFTTGAPWIGFGEAAAETSVEAEDADPASMLTYYRQLLAFRRGRAVWGAGALRVVKTDARGLVTFVREDDASAYLVAVSVVEEEQEATLPVAAGLARLAFGDGSLAPAGETARLRLPARGAAIFQLR